MVFAMTAWSPLDKHGRCSKGTGFHVVSRPDPPAPVYAQNGGMVEGSQALDSNCLGLNTSLVYKLGQVSSVRLNFLTCKAKNPNPCLGASWCMASDIMPVMQAQEARNKCSLCVVPRWLLENLCIAACHAHTAELALEKHTFFPRRKLPFTSF